MCFKVKRSVGLRPILVGVLAMVFLARVPGVRAEANSPGPEFSGARAMVLLRYQCGLGPRTPGSAGNLVLQDTLLASAGKLGFNGRRACFQATSPLTGRKMEICNVVITVPGASRGPALWLGAHFDSRPVSDMDPDPARRTEPLVGANDGASGVAVLWELMEVFADKPPQRTVVLIFLDGEDSGRAEDPSGFCLGSSHLVENWKTFGGLLPVDMPEGLILLDMIGDADLRIPQEGYSLAHAPDWTRKVFVRARKLGLPAFVQEPGGGIYDDHIPFLRRGIPAVDLIDFEYSAWHTTGDVPAMCSAGSLEQVGKLLLDLAWNP